MSYELEQIQSAKYTPEQIETCLTVLARLGTSTRASEHLKHAGIDVTPEHLRLMRSRQYPNRYAEIQAREQPAILAAAEANTLEAFHRAAEAEELLNERLIQEIPHLDKRDLAAAMKNATTSKAINMDKNLLMRGQPTQITEHRDAGALLARLRNVIDSTAEETPELPPAA
jgi:hypothetical protein